MFSASEISMDSMIKFRCSFAPALTVEVISASDISWGRA